MILLFAGVLITAVIIAVIFALCFDDEIWTIVMWTGITLGLGVAFIFAVCLIVFGLIGMTMR